MPSDSNYDLLPCPFCGGRASVRKCGFWFKWLIDYLVQCDSCDSFADSRFNKRFSGTIQEAVDRWNHRASMIEH